MTRAWHQNVKRSAPAERTVDGVVFDSKSEARRWAELRLMELAGKISELERQFKIPLVIDGRPVKIRSAGFPAGRPCVYTVDFFYRDAEGCLVFEEHKGHDDPVARLRRAVVEAIYGCEIVVTGPAAAATPRRAKPIANRRR